MTSVLGVYKRGAMEAGTVAMPNGIHGPLANGCAGGGGSSNPVDVVMTEPATFEAAAGTAMAAATPANGHIAGSKTAQHRSQLVCGI